MLIVAECLSSYEGVDLLVRHISSRLSSLEKFKCGSLIFAIDFCLRELLNNAVEHGNKFKREKKIKCIFHSIDLDVYILVKDDGPGFCLNSTLREMECEDIIRSRTRGLKTVKMLGFELDCRDGWMEAKMSIDGRGEG